MTSFLLDHLCKDRVSAHSRVLTRWESGLPQKYGAAQMGPQQEVPGQQAWSRRTGTQGTWGAGGPGVATRGVGREAQLQSCPSGVQGKDAVPWLAPVSCVLLVKACPSPCLAWVGPEPLEADSVPCTVALCQSGQGGRLVSVAGEN